MRVIAGGAHGRRIAAPKGLATRPATGRIRQSIFSRLSSRLDFAGLSVLDLFAGSGSLGIEALSRGAERAVFVDSSLAAAQAIRKNLAAFDFGSRATVLMLNVNKALARLAAQGDRFDLVFIDAPYRADTSAEVAGRLASNGLLSMEAWVVIRQSSRAEELAIDELYALSTATVSDHRIALCRPREPGPKMGEFVSHAN